MIEYAVLIVMVIFAVGFAWLWFIEQKKKRRRKEALQQKRSSDSAIDTTCDRHATAARRGTPKRQALRIPPHDTVIRVVGTKRTCHPCRLTSAFEIRPDTPFGRADFR